MENNDTQHLERLRAYWDEHQAFPSMAKLRDVVAMNSTASVFEMVGRLVEAGYLQRVEGRIAPTNTFFARPVVSVEGAAPQMADSPPEAPVLNLTDYAMPDSGRTFFVEVPDNRWAARHLLPGDLLVMQEHLPAQAGDIVTVRQDDKLLLRLLQSVHGKKLVLEPHGSAGTLGPEGHERHSVQADIAGVAVALVRRFDR